MSNPTKSQKYHDLFFDIDNTLVDFRSGSILAFKRVIEDLGIQWKEGLYDQYNLVNRRYWIAFEEEKIDNATLRSERFEAFFEEYGYGKYDGQEINNAYLNHLITTTEPIIGIKELLISLSENYRLHAITNGFKEVQRPRLDRMGITHLFDSITVSDEIGIAKPNGAYFDHAFGQNSPLPIKSKSLIIGDSLTSDIQGGNLYGVDTCWISTQLNTEAVHIPTYHLKSTLDIKQIL